MNSETGAETRIEEIESRLAFQDDLIDKLNDVIARQDREVLDLKRRLRDLEDKLAELAETASLPGAATGHEVPPHY